MSTKSETNKYCAGGRFLTEDVAVNNVFTCEDLSAAQQMCGSIAEHFMRREVLPHEQQIYDKDWDLTRKLLLRAGELELLSVDIPQAYGGLGPDKVSSAYVESSLPASPGKR